MDVGDVLREEDADDDAEMGTGGCVIGRLIS